jgi:hypothetical protein
MSHRDSTAPDASPPGRRKSHHREWTHTLDSGRKEQRIHRKPHEDADMQEGEEEDPLAAGAAAAAQNGANPQPNNDNIAAPSGDGADADGDIDMPDAAPLESDDVQMDDEDRAALAAEMQAEAEVQAAIEAAYLEARADPTSIQALMHAYRSQLTGEHTSTASFDALAHLVTTLRAMLLDSPTMLDERMDNNGQSIADPSASVVRALHEVRVTFAKSYPLPEQSWREWIEDVQTRGSGVINVLVRFLPEDNATEAELQAHKEALEADEQASAAQEQHFLLSLYRLALCDYHSPALWNSFFSYVTSVSDRLLSHSSIRRAFRLLARQAIEHDVVRAERLKRHAEEKQRRKEAKQNNKKKSEEKKDSDDAAGEAKTDEEESDEDDEADEAEEDEFSDDEEADSGVADDAADSTILNPFTSLHSALAPLMPLPYSALSSDHPPTSIESLLPSPIPIGYSFDSSDSNLFQKWRGIEMKVLTGMMRRMQQAGAGGGDQEEDVTQESLEGQMDFITRLYRMELKIPLANLTDVWTSYKDWLAKQGESAESDQSLIKQYESTKIWSASIEKKI